MAVHAEARTPAETDWKQIAALYEELLRLQCSATVALNHAVAVAMSKGLTEGLARLDALGSLGTLDQYHLYHAARADLLRRSGQKEDASWQHTGVRSRSQPMRSSAGSCGVESANFRQFH